jgi:hypothetical protein
MSKKQKRRSRIYLKSNRIIKPLVIDLNFIKKSIDNLTDKKRLPVFGIATPGKTTFAEALALRAFKCSMAEIIIPRTPRPPWCLMHPGWLQSPMMNTPSGPSPPPYLPSVIWKRTCSIGWTVQSERVISPTSPTRNLFSWFGPPWNVSCILNKYLPVVAAGTG